MSAPKLLAIVVGSLLLFGGVAAVSAAGPGEMSADNAQIDDNATDAAESADARENSPADGVAERPEAADNQSGQDQSVGPAGGLPEQVPDHVSELHKTIESFLNGTIADLGDTLQNILGSDASDADSAEDAAADEELTDEQANEQNGEETTDGDQDDEDDESASASNAPEGVPA